jgi:hypothetical protein
MHRDVVFALPAGVVNLGHSSLCEVQGMLIERKLCTFQGHPEFDEKIMSEILKKRRAQNVFDDGIYTTAMETAGNKHQGNLALSAILRFLGLLDTNFCNKKVR